MRRRDMGSNDDEDNEVDNDDKEGRPGWAIMTRRMGCGRL